jgi:hypothetical protein
MKFRLDVKFRIAHTRCKMYVINVLGLWSSCCRDFRKNSLTGPLPAFIGELTDLMHMYGSQLKNYFALYMCLFEPVLHSFSRISQEPWAPMHYLDLSQRSLGILQISNHCKIHYTLSMSNFK